jgi:hypothetical protein
MDHILGPVRWSVQEAAVGVGGVGDGIGGGRLVAGPRLDVRSRLLATSSGCRGQLGDSLLVATLPFGVNVSGLRDAGG